MADGRCGEPKGGGTCVVGGGQGGGGGGARGTCEAVGGI